MANQSPPPAISFSGIGKRFGSFAALTDVTFDVQPSVIHAVVGENGAGKTTLMKILYGSLQPDSGEYQVNGNLQSYKTPLDAARDGVGMISQHYSVIPELTNIQNLILGAEGGPWLDEKAACEKASKLAASFGLEFDWLTPSQLLSPTQTQQLEILKLLWRDARIMLLDEPTAMLAPSATEALYARVKSLVSEGRTVVVVTHRLEDVMNHAEFVTVMRGGRSIATLKVAETTKAQLTNLTFDSEVDNEIDLPTRQPATSILEVKNLVVKSDRGHRAVDGVSFKVYQNELLGVAGVDGNGQRELMECLAGLRKQESGEVLWTGFHNHGTSSLLQSGLRLIPEDRLAEAAIDSWTVDENIRLGLQRTTALNQAEQQAIAKYDAKVTSGKQIFGSLSGGNQQRVVLGRATTSEPVAILATQPARGLDLQATVNAYQGLRETGCPCLVVGFDLDELCRYCDRVIVMAKGKMLEPPQDKDRDRQTLGAMMVAGS